MSQNKNILFYSNYCQHSKICLDKVNKSNLRNDVIFFCVDENRSKIPSFITCVPTFLTSNKDIIHGQPLFRYLDSQIKNQGSQNQNQNHPTNNNVQTNDLDPLAWHGNEMGSAFSDHYSFLDVDTSAEGAGGQSIAHSFEFLNGPNNGYTNINNNEINTPEEFTKSNKTDALSQRMEQLKASRDCDVPQGISRI